MVVLIFPPASLICRQTLYRDYRHTCESPIARLHTSCGVLNYINFYLIQFSDFQLSQFSLTFPVVGNPTSLHFFLWGGGRKEEEMEPILI